MSLNYDFRNVKDYKQLLESEPARADSMVWLSLALGMPGIPDEKMAKEFYLRASLWEALHGAFLSMVVSGKKKEMPVKIDDAMRYVGLRVNVALLSRAKFVKNQVEGHFRDAECALRKEAD